MSEEERIRIEGEQQYQAHVMYRAKAPRCAARTAIACWTSDHCENPTAGVLTLLALLVRTYLLYWYKVARAEHQLIARARQLQAHQAVESERRAVQEAQQAAKRLEEERREEEERRVKEAEVAAAILRREEERRRHAEKQAKKT